MLISITMSCCTSRPAPLDHFHRFSSVIRITLDEAALLADFSTHCRFAGRRMYHDRIHADSLSKITSRAKPCFSRSSVIALRRI